MIKIFNKKINKDNKGFTLLFSVLVSTLIISISATVISIALRQTIISGTSRESQYAFYATNTVLECAFYWDVIGVPGSIGTVFPLDGGIPLEPSLQDQVTCAGGNIISGDGFTEAYANTGWDASVPGVTTIYIELKNTKLLDISGRTNRTYCAQATITKVESGGNITTTIEAKGYNTCDLTSPRAVERGLVQSYQS